MNSLLFGMNDLSAWRHSLLVVGCTLPDSLKCTWGKRDWRTLTLNDSLYTQLILCDILHSTSCRRLGPKESAPAWKESPPALIDAVEMKKIGFISIRNHLNLASSDNKEYRPPIPPIIHNETTSVSILQIPFILAWRVLVGTFYLITSIVPIPLLAVAQNYKFDHVPLRSAGWYHSIFLTSSIIAGLL